MFKDWILAWCDMVHRGRESDKFYWMSCVYIEIIFGGIGYDEHMIMYIKDMNFEDNTMKTIDISSLSNNNSKR